MDNILKLHHLKPAKGAVKHSKRKGRGEGGVRGKTAGRGTKGSKARQKVQSRFAGGQIPLYMRLPKLDGFRNHNRTVYQIVNIKDFINIELSEFNKYVFAKHGLIRSEKKLVKVLADGDIDRKVTVVADKISSAALKKIEEKGGTFNEA